MEKKFLGAALCLALFWTLGCPSLQARKMDILHSQYVRESVCHEAVMDCLERWQAAVLTAHNTTEVAKTEDPNARVSNFLTLRGKVLDRCMETCGTSWGFER